MHVYLKPWSGVGSLNRNKGGMVSIALDCMALSNCRLRDVAGGSYLTLLLCIGNEYVFLIALRL